MKNPENNYLTRVRRLLIITAVLLSFSLIFTSCGSKGGSGSGSAKSSKNTKSGSSVNAGESESSDDDTDLTVESVDENGSVIMVSGSKSGAAASNKSTGKTSSSIKSSGTTNNTVDGDDDISGSIDSSGTMTIKVEDYGAKGDGKTDDGAAINDAILDAGKYTAANSGKKAIVSFAKGKTYVAKSQNFSGSGKTASMAVSSMSNVTLQGSNTTIIGKPGWQHVQITGSSNVIVKGFNFTYDTPVAVRATVTARSGGTVTFEVPSWYTDAVSKSSLPSDAFAIPANNRRDHSWITSVTKVDNTHCTMIFSSGGHTLMNPGTKVDIPTPGYGFAGGGFQFLANPGRVTMEDCKIWNSSKFVFHINNNDGETQLTNVSLVPKDSAACPTVAWRDVVHAKDNRGKLTITNCVFGGTHDDLFNISNTMLSVTEKISGTEIRVKGKDYGESGAYVGLKAGETVTAFNPSTDKFYGTAKISQVVQQSGGNIRIKLDKDLGLDVGAYIYINERSSPGTTITGGSFSGSVRIRGSATIKDADFKLTMMWTAYEGVHGSIEGPIPSDILYKNCKFSTADGATSGARMSFTTYLLGGAVATTFGVKNIVFEGCQFAYNDIIPRNAPGVIIR